MGFDAILNERGSIPYGRDERLEEYCYKEIDLCDILVAIIGGRFGSSSANGPFSITQMEIKTALERGKQIYIFVEQSVLFEYQTYKLNKGKSGIQYQYVDNERIYQFIEEVLSLPLNNTVAPFSFSRDITNYLKEQWAGLFQRLLQD